MSRLAPRLSRALIAGALALSANAGRAQSVSVVQTTPDQTQLLAPQPSLQFATGTASQLAIQINDTIRYQPFAGTGATFNDSGAYLVQNKLTPAQRTELMRDLFSADGIHLNFLRQPMGATDLSLSNYTYDDLPKGDSDPQMQHFSIAHDQAYILPTLRQAIATNPQMKVLALPWSPPAWMKTSGSLNGGTLDPANFPALARYFTRFIQAYGANGVPINYVAVQNEPLYQTDGYPTMFMNARDQADFITNHLGPALERTAETGDHEGRSAPPGILGYEHNWDNPKYAETILEDPRVRRYLAGISFHCYAGNVADAQNAVHDLSGEPPIYFTECTGGSFAPDFASNLLNITEGQIINVLRNWGQSVIFWNMVLDQNYGPTIENGCKTCRGVITIDTSSPQASLVRNVEYYVLGHLSKYVQPGAVRIDSNSFGHGSIEDVAFKNPDGSIAVLVLNSASTPSQFSLNWQGKSVAYALPAGAVATFTWPGYPANSFDVTAGPPSRTIQAGEQTYFNIDLNQYGNVAPRPRLSIAGIPAGVEGRPFRLGSEDGAEQDSLARHFLLPIEAESASPGTYPITLTGTSGAASKSAVVDLTIGKEVPFGGAPWTLPGQIEAENFDDGGNYIGYLNLDTVDQGSAPNYRPGTTVGIENTGDTGGGYDVGYTKEGEWLRYSVNVTTPGLYILQARVASLGPGGYFHVSFDGENKTGTLYTPVTNDFQRYTTLVSPAFNLQPGHHTMQVTFDGNGPTGGMGNFNWFAVQPFTASTPFNGTAAAIPGRIEAENFDAGGKGLAYWNGAMSNNGGANARPGETVYIEACSDTGGGFDVGQTEPGAWLNYTVDIAATGTYIMHARVATAVGGGYFHLALDGEAVTGRISVPQTNGFQTWQTLDIPGVRLPQGRHTLQLVMDLGGFYNAVGNFNWIAFD